MTTLEERTATTSSTPARDEMATRLLDSAEQLSYDPAVEVDWDGPVDPTAHGASPEWSTLYGTAYWAEMTEAQRVALTRQEAASVACTGIWFEMILQQMVIRDFYAKDPTDPAFQWALTEVADECRHSIMFARGAAKLGAQAYVPPRIVVEGGRVFKTLARGEAAYAAILVAEEVLDVMQRDWMRDERVAGFARTVNNIHVVEEARHMRFAREETRDRLRGKSRASRQATALAVAFAGYWIVTSMWNSKVYENAGLDPVRARREARHNEHHRAMLRSSCAGLMEFLESAGLLTAPAKALYRAAHVL